MTDESLRKEKNGVIFEAVCRFLVVVRAGKEDSTQKEICL